MKKTETIELMRKIITDNHLQEITVESGTSTEFIVDEARFIFEKDFFDDDEVRNSASRHLFINMSTLRKIDMSKFDFSKIEDMHKWFHSCKNLTEVIFPDDMDCPKLTDVSRCFAKTNIKYLDLSHWKFGEQKINIENLASLNPNLEKLRLPKATLDRFDYLTCNCFNLREVDFNESKITYINPTFGYYGVFEGCENLHKIDCSKMKNTYKELETMFSKMGIENFANTKDDLLVVLPDK